MTQQPTRECAKHTLPDLFFISSARLEVNNVATGDMALVYDFNGTDYLSQVPVLGGHPLSVSGVEVCSCQFHDA